MRYRCATSEWDGSGAVVQLRTEHGLTHTPDTTTRTTHSDEPFNRPARTGPGSRTADPYSEPKTPRAIPPLDEPKRDRPTPTPTI